MKKKKIFILAITIFICIVTVVITLLCVFSKKEYPVIKKTKIDGGNYIREIYPEIEVRYPKVEIDEESKEVYMTDVFSQWSYDNEDDIDRMRRTTVNIFSLTDIYNEENVEKIYLRAANAAVTIAETRSNTFLESEKRNKLRYTSRWVEINLEKQRNLKMYIYCNVPIMSKVGNEYYTGSNAETTALLEKLESVVIEERVIYKDGSEKTDYFIFKSGSSTCLTNVTMFRVKLK